MSPITRSPSIRDLWSGRSVGDVPSGQNDQNTLISHPVPTFTVSPDFPVCTHIMSPAKVSPLRQLADIISSSVDKIDAHFDNLGLDYPSLDISWDPTSPSELASMSPAVVQASMLIVSACGQLSATVHSPSLTLFDAAAGVGYLFPVFC